MAIRLNYCEKCKSNNLKITQELNPDTKDMNMNVVYECQDCQCVFEGRTTSYYAKKLRKQGRII